MGRRRTSLPITQLFSSFQIGQIMTLTVQTLSFTLPAATAVQLLPADPTRQLLLRAVTSTNPATFKFGSAPTSANDGLTLDATTAAGGRILLTGASTPSDSVWAFSQLGTVVAVEVGKTYGF
jgi:hypothetical protein